MAKRVIRRKISIGTDEFVTSRSKIFRFLSDNIKTVVISSSVIGVLLLSYVGWGIYSRSKDQKAGDALYSALKLYKEGARTGEEKDRAAIGKFIDLSKSYKGTNVESIALLYAANSYYNLKEFDKAIEVYNKILFKIEREDPSLHGNINEIRISPGIVRDSALYGLAYSYEQKGDIKKAIEIQTSLASLKDSHLREEGLITIGRLYEKGGDKAKALENYQKVISDYPESSRISEIKEVIERLKG